MKNITSILILFLFSSIYAQDVAIEIFATGLNAPVDIKHAEDDRLFIVEQSGIVKIVNADGSVNSTPFLNISSIVNSAASERGLFSIAFHPDYATNGLFFLHYTNSSGNTTIAKYNVSSDPNIADASSGTILLTATQPYPNHNGGAMDFGSDGYLYIALGDGGSGGDPGDRAQNLNTLLGKMLRIDVDSGTLYGIPSNNPFATGGGLPEIWAYGLRNPWRFSFDRQTNDIWIGDVGQNTIEEIDMAPIISAGLNYGWRCYEGNSVFDTTGNCPANNTLTFPVAQFNYGGSPFRCSITGGYVYRATEYPDFQGLYFFSDYCSGEIGTLSNATGSWVITWNPSTGANLSTFGESQDGTLYTADLTSGNIYKVIDTTLSVEEFSLNNIKIYPNPTQNEFHIDFLNNAQSITELNVFNIQGKLLLNFNSIDSEIFKVSTQSFESGLYLVSVSNNKGEKITKKIVIN